MFFVVQSKGEPPFVDREPQAGDDIVSVPLHLDERAQATLAALDLKPFDGFAPPQVQLVLPELTDPSTWEPFLSDVVYDLNVIAIRNINIYDFSTPQGWIAFTLATALPVGTGPIFGITPDANTFAILQIAPVAQPGNPLHWTWPAFGVYPQVPLVAPPGTLGFTGTWDFLGVAVDAGLGLTPTFNVSRVIW